MVILSSPSGAGKTTLVKLLSERRGFVTSISHTTRTPRSNEIDGKDYYFVNNVEFERMIKSNEFLEKKFIAFVLEELGYDPDSNKEVYIDFILKSNSPIQIK